MLLVLCGGRQVPRIRNKHIYTGRSYLSILELRRREELWQKGTCVGEHVEVASEQ